MSLPPETTEGAAAEEPQPTVTVAPQEEEGEMEGALITVPLGMEEQELGLRWGA